MRRVLGTGLVLAAACAAPEGGDHGTDARVERVRSGLRPAVTVQNAPPVTYRLADQQARLHVPGVSIAVVDSGRIVWARGFGVKEAGTSDSVTETTLFQAASISKPVAATGMLRLVEEGKLDLDTPVNTYLTSWQLPDNRFTAKEPVTLRRIVSHNAGLTVHGFPGYATTDSIPTVPQILDGAKPANTAAVRVDTAPGTIWRYSGGGITIEQLVMTDVTGEPFPALMKRLVLDPTGMSHSTYHQPLPEDRREEAAAAHRSDGTMIEGRWHVYPEMAAAGLWTTPSDLLHWAMAIAAARRGDSGGVVSPAMARQMLTVQAAPTGLGPFLEGEGRGFNFGHGGSNEGYRCQLVYFPETGQGAAVMTNGDAGSSVIQQVLFAIAAEYGWPDYGPRSIEAVALDSATRAAYVGDYATSEPFEATGHVTAAEGRLYLEVEKLFPKSELVFTDSTHAVSRDDGTRFAFETAAGRATAITTGPIRLARKP